MINNVIIFTGAFSSGGAEKQSILLGKILNDSGYDVIVVSFYGEKYLLRHIKYLETENINFELLNGSLYNKIRRLSEIIKINKPRFIINYLPSNNLIGGILGKVYGVATIIGNIRNSRLGFRKYLELLFCHIFLNDVTIFNNKSGQNYYKKRGFNLKKTVFIPNFIFEIPSPKTLFCKNTDHQDINILMVSRFEKQKDYETALNAFRKLKTNTKNLNVSLTIIGDGSLENLVKEMIVSKGLTEEVEVIVNPDDIFLYYDQADIFLQTSIFEGFSNSIMEALSYSLPVVATNVGDNSSLIKEGYNGFLTPVKNSDYIADKLEELVNSYELRNDFGKNSYIFLNENFTYDHYKKNINKVLKTNE
jgi:glycosyltransferase involved in cell wall biosynthesis